MHVACCMISRRFVRVGSICLKIKLCVNNVIYSWMAYSRMSICRFARFTD